MPLNINIQQILLHLLNFVILFAILYFLLYNPVKKFMEKRTEEYKKMDDSAKQNLAEAERIKDKYTKRIMSADAEIEKMKADAEKDAESLADKRLKIAELEAETIIKTARSVAENEKKKIIDSAQKDIAEIITTAAEKVVGSSSDVYNDFLENAEKNCILDK